MQRVEAVYKQAIIFNIAATGKHPIPDPAAPGEEVKAPGCSQTDQQSYSCESSLTHRGSEGLDQPRQWGGRQAGRGLSQASAAQQQAVTPPKDHKALVRLNVIKNKRNQPQNSILRLLICCDYQLSCCPPPSSCFPVTTPLLYLFMLRLEVFGSRVHFHSIFASLLPHRKPGLHLGFLDTAAIQITQNCQ